MQSTAKRKPTTLLDITEAGEGDRNFLLKPIPRVINMRLATSRDLTEIYDCLIQYFKDVAMPYPSPVEKDVIAWGLRVVEQDGVVVAECDGRIIGSVGLELGTFPWNHGARYLNAVWCFVLPDFRNGSTGVRLIEQAKRLADKNGLPLRMDEIWAYRSFLMGKLKERKGFTNVGSNWAYFPPDINRIGA